jgi:sugar diacid utilization regulator/putative methionine-R-sulfoxide reductase with GAF domain
MATGELKVRRPRSATTGSTGVPLVQQIGRLASRIARLIDSGSAVIFAESERTLVELTGFSAHLYVNAAGQWHDWRQLDTPDEMTAALVLPDGFETEIGLFSLDNQMFLPIIPGSIVATLDGDVRKPDMLAALSALSSCIAMAVKIRDRQDSTARSVSELEVMRAVASRILQSNDLDEILLLVSHETKRLLASDICGVMMREGDDVVMKSCVGHFSTETAKLKMHSGVGVAGHVLATGEPFMVADYVQNATITADFVPLARLEKVRSAFAVPIFSSNDMIGILEVWRRRPSMFTDEDRGLLQALAGLASLAIENARLLAARARSTEALAIVHAELAERYSIIEAAARFQEEIARLMLDDSSLAPMAARTAEFTDGTIFILDYDLNVEAAGPRRAASDVMLIAEIRALLKTSQHLSDKPLAAIFSTGEVYAQPVLTGIEMLGWVVWHGHAATPEGTRLALGNVALATAMHLLERRRVARERSETLQAVLWDLTEGSEAVRAAAMDRARELHVAVKGSICMIVMEIGKIGSADGSERETHLQDRIMEQAKLSEIGRTAYMVGARGSQLRMVCKATTSEQLAEGTQRLIETLRREAPMLEPIAGIGSFCNDIRALPSAFREAMVALEVARHRKGVRVAHYSEAGVLGLLINLRTKADMSKVSRDILGHLLTEPEQSRQVLLKTLSSYFECDCSQLATAARLGVHQKTIAYRIAKICRLTGLDLGRHQDRVLADIGVKLYTIMDLE